MFLGAIEYQKSSSTAGRHLKINSKSTLARPAFYPGLEYPATTDWNYKFGRCLDWLILMRVSESLYFSGSLISHDDVRGLCGGGVRI